MHTLDMNPEFNLMSCSGFNRQFPVDNWYNCAPYYLAADFFPFFLETGASCPSFFFSEKEKDNTNKIN